MYINRDSANTINFRPGVFFRSARPRESNVCSEFRIWKSRTFHFSNPGSSTRNGCWLLLYVPVLCTFFDTAHCTGCAPDEKDHCFVMILVLSFAAVVILLQKFDFRNCMLKSDNHAKSVPSQGNKNDDDDSDSSYGAILTAATTDSEWIEEWSDMNHPSECDRPNRSTHVTIDVFSGPLSVAQEPKNS